MIISVACASICTYVFLLPVTGTPNFYDRQVIADALLHDGQDLVTCLDSPVPKVPGSDGTEYSRHLAPVMQNTGRYVSRVK